MNKHPDVGQASRLSSAVGCVPPERTLLNGLQEFVTGTPAPLPVHKPPGAVGASPQPSEPTAERGLGVQVFFKNKTLQREPLFNYSTIA
ncbi:MAG: hypothetical protein KME26_05650 [Oscillatoria princeps RMCB-10]|nr:hypothetical protein [Oscillatoria princeps RMCB-10]